MKRTIILLAALSLLVISCQKEVIKPGPSLGASFNGAFLVGAALNDAAISGKDAGANKIVTSQFNTITNENLLKWEVVHPEPDSFNFEPADAYVAFGEANGMVIIGHTLTWHHQTPNWVFEGEDGGLTDRETLIARMENHISTVVGRYKGRINGWDVVNEALNEDGSLRDSKWRQIIGDDYIDLAFKFAQAADPGAELYYNDYNMFREAKALGAVALINHLKAEGLRVDAVGMQGHWGPDFPQINDAENSIQIFKNAELTVVVTELDINMLPRPENMQGADIELNYENTIKFNPYAEGLPDSMQTVLTDRYAEFFSLFKKYGDTVDRVTFWGVYDGSSWLDNWPIVGRTNYPLLFDRQYNPKPAYHAVIKVGEVGK